MKYFKCPHCELCINLDHLKDGNLCIMCGSPLKPLEHHELSNEIKPNY